jgi:prepilin-type processing-associated H-X9-DG protein
MEDIVFVTGCHLARSFANIAFSDGHGEEQVSFEVKLPNVSKVEWQFPFEDVQLAALNVGPSGQVRLPLLSRLHAPEH